MRRDRGTAIQSPAVAPTRWAALRGPMALALTLAAGLGLSIALFLLILAQEDARAHLGFTSEAQECFASIERQTSDNVLVLDSLVALFASSRDVGRREFQSFAGSLLSSHPELHALQWIPAVKRADRAALEASARAEGFESFTFVQRDESGALVEAAQREEYHPVFYVEPLAGNEEALGYDLGSDRALRETLARSRDTGQAVAAPARRLGRGPDASYSVLIVHPVYGSGITPPTATSRRADLAGHVVGTFDIGRVTERALRPLERELADIWLFESGGDGPDRLVHYAEVDPDADAPPPTEEQARERLAAATLTSQTEVEVAGESWVAVAAPAADSFTAHRTPQPWLALAAGLISTGALAGYVRSLESRNREERRHAAEIQWSNATLQREMEERKRIEARLHETQRLEAVGRLAGGIAHDFNNLLTAITASAGLLRRADRGSTDWDEDIRAIERAADSAAALTRQLLAFSRRQVMVPEPLDLNRVLLDMERIIRRIVGEGVRVDLRVWNDPLPILADRAQIEQVLLNLVVNARDAMSGGGDLTIAAATGGTPGEPTAGDGGEGVGDPEGPSQTDQVTLTVSDTGSGIDPEALPLIFEPFFSTKGPEERSGLGLATVYGIVSQSGGSISVESTPEEGTTFHVRLPRHEHPLPDVSPASSHDASRLPKDSADRARDAVSASEGAPAPLDPDPAEPPRTVLVAEDEPGVLELTRRILERGGYGVITASSGEEALERAATFEGDIHLLLTDVMMPGMNGKELAERIVSMRADVPVLFMSGYSADIIAPEGVLETGVHFLAKPFSPESLMERLDAVLHSG